ncbi:T9SS type A sorting domain-containing protein [Pontibacter sp. JH31]|uniref:T9SS type A sorting domain-containing protein n=1 Tax=Pontibacter aquaedesilientis TaxID=2766980 RepID=A0ABR7XKP0_9BACT|nr:T9SS type A sorting domain-containing protein [Pontibacter aquaedesilientis]MBD1398845.1 T9SS type A sorting domain-containing protein [Pontibacter aquaedesilientis]
MSKKLALTVVCFCCSMVAMAQVMLMPLQQDLQRQFQAPVKQQLRLQQTPLTLPFFDDFSATSITPDPARWINGGVYVSSRFALRPITRQAASFDGLNANGQAYGSSSAGPADTLTSQPIKLQGLSPADSVYLSFYWQSGGLGDVPDRTSNNSRFLQLEFKDNTGVWRPVWQQAGLGNATDFAQVFVALREQRFFHDNFQFRFRSEGSRNGLLDVWNLDYVEMDRNRRKGQNTTRDIGISRSVSPLLNGYTAMPARQFLANPTLYLSKEVTASVNNLGTMPGAIAWRGFVKRAGAVVADTFLREQGLLPGQVRQFEIKGSPRISNLNLSNEGFVLQHGFLLDTKEPNALQRANDSTLRSTQFADYFAYDDGTAEGGFSYVSSSSATQVAQRFDLSLPDQVRAFRVHFPLVGSTLRNTSVTFKIWADENGIPGRTLHEQSFQVQYTEGLNTFYEVQLSEPVAVDGSFYIGWSQPGTTFLNVGFDRNHSASGRRFLFSNVTGWQEDTSLEGAVMLRPVMSGQALGIEEIPEAERVQVYPNPSRGVLYFKGEYLHFSMFDITGREIFRQKASMGQVPVQLPQLAPGLYTIRITTDKHIFTTKLFLIKP